MRPHYSHSSREIATPPSGTSLLASCKGVPPGHFSLVIVQHVNNLVLKEFSLCRVLCLNLWKKKRIYESCNCRQKNSCPLNGNCLQSSVIYQATVKRNDNNTSETYIGLTENAFKTRYRNHTASFRHTKHRNSTELSKHVWSLKDNNIVYSISWRTISSSSSCNSSNNIHEKISRLWLAKINAPFW